MINAFLANTMNGNLLGCQVFDLSIIVVIVV